MVRGTKRLLIVNADDCNLTRGVTRAILEAHDDGIVGSTTFFVNLPSDKKEIQAFKKRKSLGVGIHLNVTLGYPVSCRKKVRSLTDEGKGFRRRQDYLTGLPRMKELILEYEGQILVFQKLFGRAPTHLDTHHQLHDHPFFLRALACVARRHNLPVRRSRLNTSLRLLRCPDFLFGSLSAACYWTPEALESLLLNLPQGVSEIACHPGIVDKDLEAASSFVRGRGEEYLLFKSKRIKKLAEGEGIVLGNYSMV